MKLSYEEELMLVCFSYVGGSSSKSETRKKLRALRVKKPNEPITPGPLIGSMAFIGAAAQSSDVKRVKP